MIQEGKKFKQTLARVTSTHTHTMYRITKTYEAMNFEISCNNNLQQLKLDNFKIKHLEQECFSFLSYYSKRRNGLKCLDWMLAKRVVLI